MSVFKRYNGKRLSSDDPNWDRGTWYMWQRIGGGKVVHKSLRGVSTESEALEIEKALIRTVAGKMEHKHARRLAKRADAILQIEKPEYVYLLQSGGYIKIGRTTDIQSRVKAVNDTITPFDVHLLMTVRVHDSASVERSLHLLYEPFRVKGEWFNISQKMIAPLMMNLLNFGIESTYLQPTDEKAEAPKS